MARAVHNIEILRSLYIFTITLCLFVISVSITEPVFARNSSYNAVLIRIEGYTSLIDTPVQEYVQRALRFAEERRVPLLIYLDTYGGYLDPALNIVNTLLESKVPIIVYVKNKAYSAGTLIALASHILVMSKNGVIGAAQPVSINPVTGEVVFVNESKIVNPIIKVLEICASARNRNRTLVKRFVYENVVLTGEEALKFGIANVLAESLEEVLRVVRGVELNISGTLWRLDIDSYEELKPGIDIYALVFLRNSAVNSILLFIGIFGTLILITSGRLELLPITILLLLLALVGSDISNRVISLLLMALGAVMLFIELFITPGFGILGISGILSLIFGILLTPLPTASYVVDVTTLWRALVIISCSTGSLFLFILYKSIKALRKPRTISYAPERKIIGKAVDKLGSGTKGFVMIDGELWIAESDEVIEPGEEVEVVERKGFVIKVRKKR
ncbi:MAG: ATP-dependent Clp protease proteolytic subunit [Desulfurococcaceae archaeon]|nr:ATP-dependent Clp protease proteolytic subunit [Desulfurococcaceae archaeon]MCC6058454.1 ATP-dependent Clp protease proteolytic subunit [Desulfurococcaceae archaeon]